MESFVPPIGGIIVCDWDNTLKLYDHHSRRKHARVSVDKLLEWKIKYKNELYVISAIRPSRINLETILSEVKELDMLEAFDAGEGATSTVIAGEYAKRGNVVICGYDKAETFLKLRQDCDDTNRIVTFFDDEVVNIDNFGQIVPGSVCVLVI